jgi:hypothetical protein
MRRLRIAITVTVICTVAIGLLFPIVGAYVSLQAERTLIAYRQVLWALTAYVDENDGRWPQSWEQLSECALRNDPVRFQGFADLADIRRRVHVRFDVTAHEVALMKRDGFLAVTQIGSNYGEEPSLIERLQEACSKFRRNKGRHGGLDSVDVTVSPP